MRTPALASLLVAAVAATQLGATDCGQIIEDPGFDHWCGDQLCYWTTEKGTVRRVPTWHAGDDGAEFVGDDVAISQLTPVDWIDTSCIAFEMVADVEETAEVRLEADVFDDGTIDWSERVPTARWERITFRIGVEGRYEGIRFRLTKTGSGRAVLAQIGAEVETGCPSYVDVVARPLGASCLLGEDCDSGVCAEGVCSECVADADCGGDVCGRADDPPGHLEAWRACVPAASRAVGEPCFIDGECASGACNGLYCGECGGDVACEGGETCDVPALEVPIFVCGPSGAGDGAPGDPCVLDADCASGACDGRPVGYCDTGAVIPCYEDDDCPVAEDLSPGTCTLVAVAGGTCQ